ncbi:hypothetical protein ACLOJK_012426 [Asimina triloba]
MVMFVAFYVAVLGTLSYYRTTPQGSPFAVLLVLVASAPKIRLDYPAKESKMRGRVNPNCSSSMADYDCEASAHPSPPIRLDDSINGADKQSFRLPHTNRLRPKLWPVAEPLRQPVHIGGLRKQLSWMNQLRRNPSKQVEAVHPNGGEESKHLLRLFPIRATFLMYGMVLSLGRSFFIAQANTLDRKLSPRFQVPITFLSAVSALSKLVVTKACLPLLNWLSGLGSGVSRRIRIGVGFLVAAFCCPIAFLRQQQSRYGGAKQHSVTVSEEWEALMILGAKNMWSHWHSDYLDSFRRDRYYFGAVFTISTKEESGKGSCFMLGGNKPTALLQVSRTHPPSRLLISTLKKLAWVYRLLTLLSRLFPVALGEGFPTSWSGGLTILKGEVWNNG